MSRPGFNRRGPTVTGRNSKGRRPRSAGARIGTVPAGLKSRAGAALPVPHAIRDRAVRQDDLVEFIADEQGTLLSLSPNWEAVTGYTMGSALGARLDQYVWPEDREAFQAELESLLRGRSDEVCQPL